jgi:hypothetical protein
LNARDYLFSGLAAAVVMDDYVGPPAAEGVRSGSADAGARAGDEDGLVLELRSLNHSGFCKRFLF